MEEIVEREQPDSIVHLGDHAADAAHLERLFPRIPICYVRGNCDYTAFDVPDEAEFTWQGLRFFAVHGHRYGVKSGLMRLEYAAMEREANIVLYGHTHCPHCEELKGLWIMNPGACNKYDPSYGIIEIQDGLPQCRIKNLNSEESL